MPHLEQETTPPIHAEVALKKRIRFLRWVWHTLTRRIPKGLLWGGILWLGLVVMVNVLFSFWNPMPKLLPPLNKMMQEKHASRFAIPQARVSILPWGTVQLQIPDAIWTNAQQSGLWRIQGQGLKLPIHLWRFPFGGESALLGTIQVKEAKVDLKGKAGIAELKSVLKTFKSEKKPSPFTEYIKVHVHDGRLIWHPRERIDRILPHQYTLRLNQLHTFWHRSPKWLKVSMNPFALMNDTSKQVVASGRLQVDSSLGSWMNLASHATPTADAFWHALRQTGDVHLQLNLPHGGALLEGKLGRTLKKSQPQLDFHWFGTKAFLSPLLKVQLKSSRFKETALTLEGKWKLKATDSKESKSTTHSGLTIESLILTHPHVDLKLSAELTPQCQSRTPLKDLWHHMAWQGKGTLTARPFSDQTALGKLMASEGVAWQAGHLHAKIQLNGKGNQDLGSQLKLSTPQPLGLRFTRNVKMGTVSFPQGTRLSQFQLFGRLTPQSAIWEKTTGNLQINPNAQAVKLETQGAFQFPQKHLTIQASSPLLNHSQLSAFLKMNPHLVPEPYGKLLSQDNWQGGIRETIYHQNTQADTFDVEGKVDAQFPHPQAGKALPLSLQGQVLVQGRNMKAQSKQVTVQVGRSLATPEARIQVGNAPAIQGYYEFQDAKTFHQLALQLPKQAIAPLLTWSNALGTRLSLDLAPTDALGVNRLVMRLQGTRIQDFTLEKGLLDLGQMAQAQFSADCQAHCQWHTQGKMLIPEMMKRVQAKRPEVKVLTGQALWDLTGRYQLGASTLQQVNGFAKLKQFTAQYKRHPQPIQLPQLEGRALGNRWQIQPASLQWGPLTASLKGQGTLGIVSGKCSHLELDVPTLHLKTLLSSAEDAEEAIEKNQWDSLAQGEAWQRWWKGLGVTLPERVNPTGKVKTHLELVNGEPLARLSLNEVGGFFPSLAPEPMAHINGTLEYQSGNRFALTQDGLKGYYGLSVWDASQLSMKASPQGVDLEGRFLLDLHPRELNRLMAKASGKQMTHYNVSSHAEMNTHLHLPAWDLTHPQSEGFAQIALKMQPILAEGERPYSLLESQSFFTMKQGNWELEKGEFYPLGIKEPLYVKASLDAPKAFTHLFSSQARIWTEKPLDLKNAVYHQQNPYAKGQLETDMAWTSENGSPLGFIALQGIETPLLEVKKLQGRIDLEADKAQIHIQDFETAKGSALQWKAQLDLPQALPFQVKESHVHSTYWDLNDLSETLLKQVSFWEAPFQNSESKVSAWKPHYRRTYPFELRNSLLTWDMGVFQNIAVQEGQGLVNVYQNGLVQLEDTRFKIVDGNLLMAVSIDPFNNNLIALKLQAQDVPANPVFYGLTGLQQLVIGKLNGQFELMTEGMSNNELLANASGKARIRIEEGRIPELVTVENILSKVSVVRGGILNLDLSDLGTFLKRVDKNSPEISETYQTDFQIVNGLFLTNQLETFGERLNLNVKGSLNLLSQDSKMMIRAGISDQQAGLNPLKFNAIRALRLLPIFGKLPHKDYGLIDYIPVVGYIPAFGFGNQDTNLFYVKVNGRLDNPKNFELPQWVNGANHFNTWSYNIENRPKDLP